MRKTVIVLMLVLIISGCHQTEGGMEKILDLRNQLQTCEHCSFTSEITADYGETIYKFTMRCEIDGDGNLSFEVDEPDTLQGISGTISGGEGNLVFDDKMLAFQLLADDQITPVSAPWIVMNTLRGGYIRACAETDAGVKAIIDDSYEEDSLQVDVWLDESGVPSEAEILWDGRRILSVIIKDFSCV